MPKVRLELGGTLRVSAVEHVELPTVSTEAQELGQQLLAAADAGEQWTPAMMGVELPCLIDAARFMVAALRKRSVELTGRDLSPFATDDLLVQHGQALSPQLRVLLRWVFEVRVMFPSIRRQVRDAAVWTFASKSGDFARHGTAHFNDVTLAVLQLHSEQQRHGISLRLYNMEWQESGEVKIGPQQLRQNANLWWEPGLDTFDFIEKRIRHRFHVANRCDEETLSSEQAEALEARVQDVRTRVALSRQQAGLVSEHFRSAARPRFDLRHVRDLHVGLDMVRALRAVVVFQSAETLLRDIAAEFDVSCQELLATPTVAGDQADDVRHLASLRATAIRHHVHVGGPHLPQPQVLFSPSQPPRVLEDEGLSEVPGVSAVGLPLQRLNARDDSALLLHSPLCLGQICSFTELLQQFGVCFIDGRPVATRFVYRDVDGDCYDVDRHEVAEWHAEALRDETTMTDDEAAAAGAQHAAALRRAVICLPVDGTEPSTLSWTEFCRQSRWRLRPQVVMSPRRLTHAAFCHYVHGIDVHAAVEDVPEHFQWKRPAASSNSVTSVASI